MKKINPTTLTATLLLVTLITVLISAVLAPETLTGLLWAFTVSVILHLFTVTLPYVVRHFRLDDDMTRIDDIESKLNEMSVKIDKVHNTSDRWEALEKDITSIKGAMKWTVR